MWEWLSSFHPPLHCGQCTDWNRLRTHTVLGAGWLPSKPPAVLFIIPSFLFFKAVWGKCFRTPRTKSPLLCSKRTYNRGLCSEASSCTEPGRLMSKPTQGGRSLSPHAFLRETTQRLNQVKAWSRSWRQLGSALKFHFTELMMIGGHYHFSAAQIQYCWRWAWVSLTEKKIVFCGESEC